MNYIYGNLDVLVLAGAYWLIGLSRSDTEASSARAIGFASYF